MFVYVTVEEWTDYPNIIQVLSVESDIIALKFGLKQNVQKRTKFTLKDIVDKNGGITKDFYVQRRKNIATIDVDDNDDIEANKEYKLAIFDANDKQISNIIDVQTPTETFEADDRYKPYAPLKESVEQYYDEQKENILIIWNHPKLTFGEEIMYKLKLSNKAETEELTEFPLKLPMESTKFTITTISIFGDTIYESKPSETIHVDLPTAPPIPLQYLNEEQVLQYISIKNEIKDKSFLDFRCIVIQKCGVQIDETSLNALRIKAKLADDIYNDILSEDNFNEFVSNDSSKSGITLIAYFHPTLPPKLKSYRIDSENNRFLCKYETFAPFKLQYEILSESNTNNTLKRMTETATDTIIIDDISSKYKEKFCVRAKCVFDNTFHAESPFSEYSPMITPSPTNINNQQS